ncbi:hypothetical protein [Streptomyces sp. NPDC058718]|uniref:hypothetical protein n=1 Tax=Streptomyces sp. NPDC058718 TaxID=3346610 RepID=UPI0036A55C48
MTALTDPLDDAQQFLVDLLWSTFAEHKQFPHFFYVNHLMRIEGHDAVTVLHSFPTMGTLLTPRYRAIGWWGPDHNPDANGPVYLTLAGLYHVADDPMADAIGSGLLTFIRDIAQAQNAILDSPFKMPEISVNLDSSMERVVGVQNYVQHMALIAQHEWPGLGFDKNHRTGRLGMLTSAEFSSLADYLGAVTAALTPPVPVDALPFAEPRALLRALNFLDVTSELVINRRLVSRPPMDRSSLLALDADDEATFQAGLVVLTDILRDLQVPGGTPANGLNRLEAHLVDRLPAINRAAVHQAVELLDQVRVLRNSAVHPKPSPRLLTAHQALGLPFPVRDFTAAWDSVRAHAERALIRLQEEIQAARPLEL